MCYILLYLSSFPVFLYHFLNKDSFLQISDLMLYLLLHYNLKLDLIDIHSNKSLICQNLRYDDLYIPMQL